MSDEKGKIIIQSSPLNHNPDLLLSGYESFNLMTLQGHLRQEVLRTYDLMMLDDKVSQVIDITEREICGLDWNLESDNEKEKEILKEYLTSEININSYFRHLLRARIYGFSVFEIIWKKKGQYYFPIQPKLLPYQNVKFTVDKYGQLEKLEYLQQDIPLDWVQIYTYPVNEPDSYHYGKSDLQKIYREWYTKDTLIKYRNLGLENFAFPIVVAYYDQAKYNSDAKKGELNNLLSEIKNDGRISLPASRDVNGDQLTSDIRLELLEPAYSSGGFQAFQDAIKSLDTAINRNLGMPDDLGFTDTAHGSRAKAEQESPLYWATITALAESIEKPINELISKIVGYNFTSKIKFSFDMNKDKGLTDTKVQIIKGLKEANINISESYIAEYLGIDISDIEDKEEPIENNNDDVENIPVPDTAIPENVDDDVSDNFESNDLKNFSKKVVQYERIRRVTDSIETRYSNEIEKNIEDGQKEWFSKTATKAKDGKLTDNIKADHYTVESFPSKLKTKIKNSFKALYLESYFTGKEEAISELEKQKSDLPEDEAKELYENLYCDTEEYTNESNIDDYVKDWQKKSKIKLNPADRIYMSRIDELAYSQTRDLLDRVAKANRDFIISDKLRNLEGSSVQAMTTAVTEELKNLGILGIAGISTPSQIQTIVRTSTMEYYNQARMNELKNPELHGIIAAYQYFIIDDGRETDFCKMHADEIIAADDPNLEIITPPNHWNCRSQLTPINKYKNPQANYGNNMPNGKNLDSNEYKRLQEAYSSPAKGFGGKGTVELNSTIRDKIGLAK